jgi:hypothetical protein
MPPNPSFSNQAGNEYRAYSDRSYASGAESSKDLTMPSAGFCSTPFRIIVLNVQIWIIVQILCAMDIIASMHVCIFLPFCKVYTFRMNLSLNLSSITTLAFFQLSLGRFGSNSRTKLPFLTFKQDFLPHPSFLKLVDVLVHDKFS